MNNLIRLLEAWVGGADNAFVIHDRLMELGYPKVAAKHFSEHVCDRKNCEIAYLFEFCNGQHEAEFHGIEPFEQEWFEFVLWDTECNGDGAYWDQL